MLAKAKLSTETAPFLTDSPLSLCSLSFIVSLWYSYCSTQKIVQMSPPSDKTRVLQMLKCRCHKFHT